MSKEVNKRKVEMKELIKVNVRTRQVDVDRCEADLLAVGMFSDVKKLDEACAKLDSKLGGAIQRVIKLGDFTGKEGSSSVIYSNGAIGAERVLLVGLGEKKKAGLDTARKAAANAANTAVNMKIKNLGLCLHRAFGGRVDLSDVGRATAEGAFFGSYRYDEFVTGEEDGRAKLLNVEVVDSNAARIRRLDKGLCTGAVIGRAQSYARTLSNRPGNVISPASLAAEAKKLARATAGLSCVVFDEKQLATKGMAGILAVGSGSQNKPRLIILKYHGAGKTTGGKEPVSLVGKAVTFDSGGISMKPPAHMERMKLDKSGGIAVLATMKAAAELKLGVNVYGIIPAAENLPSGTSYRPGDIVKTYSGKTVEVQNTDAEGRMMLCDALVYAAEQKCDPIIDIATLTGACEVALGRHHAGLMGNDERLKKQIQQAAKDSGEKVWPLPSGQEYAEEVKSKIADLKNTGGRWGGACTAAAFLGQFVSGARWAHLDMAGMDMFEKATKYATEGSSGYGVRLLTTYLLNKAKKKK